MKILATVFTLAICASAQADCRTRVVSYAQTYVQPVYAAVYTPIFVPTYSISYTGGQSQTSGQSQDVKAILEELKGLRADVENMKRGAPQERAPNQAHLKLFTAKCAACHEQTVAQDKGGGFALLQGGLLANLTDKQLRRIGSQTYTGKMPKGGKITDEEVGVIQEWLDAQK